MNLTQPTSLQSAVLSINSSSPLNTGSSNPSMKVTFLVLCHNAALLGRAICSLNEREIRNLDLLHQASDQGWS